MITWRKIPHSVPVIIYHPPELWENQSHHVNDNNREVIVETHALCGELFA